MTDHTLLQQWTVERDAEAFRQIAARYAGMVYATCVRVLGNASDAEDVSQECFETLARLNEPPKSHLGAWLHKVAVNRAIDRVRSDRRRKGREAQFVAKRKTQTEVVWDDIYMYIDDAIVALPDKLRMPIVAHFLDNQSYTAIARSLDVSPRTVAYRVRKSVELVRKSLRKRGIPLGTSVLAGLLAANAAEAASVPASLTAALGKLAIAGAASTCTVSTAASGTTLAVSGGLAIMTAKKVLIGMGALATLLLVAYSLSNLQGSNGGKRPDIASDIITPATVDTVTELEREKPVLDEEEPAELSAVVPEEEEKTEEETEMLPGSVSGIVIDDAGYPIEGASLNLDVTGDLGYHDVLKTYSATTGADGRYEIAEIQVFGEAIVWASTKGYIMANERGINIAPGTAQKGVNFTLENAEFYVSGWVVSESSQPIPGASVNLQHWAYTDEMIARGRLGWQSTQYKFAFARTDDDGHFEIPIPLEGLCDFYVMKQDYAPGFFPRIRTGTTDALFELRAGGGAIAGTVTLPDKTAIEGATINVLGRAIPAGSSDRGPHFSIGVVTATTDDDGTYIVKNLSEDYVYTVGVERSTGQLLPFMDMQQVRNEGLRSGKAYVKRGIEVKTGQTTGGVDFVLYPPARVYGKVTDASSGRPAYPVRVLAVGEVRGGILGFGSRPKSILGSVSTDENGSYDLPLGVDGRLELQIWWKFDEGQGGNVGDERSKKVTTLQLDPSDEEEVSFTVPAAPINVPIRFVDRNGVPLEGIRAGMRVPWDTDGINGRGLISDTDGRVTWRSAPANQTYRVIGFVTEPRLMAPRFMVLGISEPFTGEPGETVPEVVVVCSTYDGVGGIEGVILDADGMPVAGAGIECRALLEDGKLTDEVVVGDLEAATRADGSFVMLDALPNGIHPRLVLTCETEDQLEMAVIDNVRIEVDGVTDLGTIRLEPITREQAEAVLPTG